MFVFTLNDILITGGSLEDTGSSPFKARSSRNSVKTQEMFMLSLEYFGHKFSSRGLQPTSEKVQAIHEAPAPKNVSQLKSQPTYLLI